LIDCSCGEGEASTPDQCSDGLRTNIQKRLHKMPVLILFAVVFNSAGCGGGDGLKFSLAKRDRTFFTADKDGHSFTFGFHDCRKMLSTCSRVHVANTSTSKPTT
jgi:hypothetical protein